MLRYPVAVLLFTPIFHAFEDTFIMSSHESLSPRTSDTMDESKHFLLQDEARHSVLKIRHRNRKTWFNKTVIITTLDLILFVAALAVWSHVHVLLRSFNCDPEKRQDNFEPDCKLRPTYTNKLRCLRYVHGSDRQHQCYSTRP